MIMCKPAEVMTVCKGEPTEPCIKLNVWLLEQVKELKYPGSLIIEENRRHAEI